MNPGALNIYIMEVYPNSKVYCPMNHKEQDVNFCASCPFYFGFAENRNDAKALPVFFIDCKFPDNNMNTTANPPLGKLDREYVLGAGFRRLLRSAHAEGLLGLLLEAEGIDLALREHEALESK